MDHEIKQAKEWARQNPKLARTAAVAVAATLGVFAAPWLTAAMITGYVAVKLNVKNPPDRPNDPGS